MLRPLLLVATALLTLLRKILGYGCMVDAFHSDFLKASLIEIYVRTSWTLVMLVAMSCARLLIDFTLFADRASKPQAHSLLSVYRPLLYINDVYVSYVKNKVDESFTSIFQKLR